MSTRVQEILDRMNAQKRSGTALAISPRRRMIGTMYSSRVSPVKSPEVAPKAGTTENISSGCGTRKMKGGEGARGMDTKDIEKFINEKAPREIKNKLARMQKKPRIELCKLLAQFPAGRKLVYSETEGKKPKAATPPSPKNANNLNAMFAQMNFELKRMANKQEKKEQKFIKKIINRRNIVGPGQFNISPVSTPGNTPNSNNENNYINYNNNGNNENRNFRAKGLQEAYMMRLASKRVEKDPLEQTLTKYQRMKFAPRSVKLSPKKTTTVKRSRPLRNKTMSFGPNARVSTVVRAPTISTRTKLSAAQLMNARNTTQKRMNTLRSTLRNLRNKKNPTKLQKARIRVLSKLVNSNANATQTRVLNKEVGKIAALINLGLVSPPRVRSPPKTSFSMMRPIMEGTPEKIRQMMKKKVPSPKPINTEAILRARQQYETAMNFLIDGKPCMDYSKGSLVKMAKVFYPRKKDLASMSKKELCQKLRPKMQKILS